MSRKYFPELPIRTANCLAAENLFTRDDVIAFLEKDQYGLIKIANLGKKGIKAISDALNIDGIKDELPKPDKQKVGRVVSQQTIDAAIKLLERNGYRVEKVSNAADKGPA